MDLLRFLSLLLVLTSAPAFAAPKVVVSIKPLHSLAARVTDGVTAPRLLIAGAASPHSYSLKPSDMTALEEAGVVFWLGPAFEAFLMQPLAAVRASPGVRIPARVAIKVRVGTQNGNAGPLPRRRPRSPRGIGA